MRATHAINKIYKLISFFKLILYSILSIQWSNNIRSNASSTN